MSLLTQVITCPLTFWSYIMIPIQIIFLLISLVVVPSSAYFAVKALLKKLEATDPVFAKHAKTFAEAGAKAVVNKL